MPGFIFMGYGPWWLEQVVLVQCVSAFVSQPPRLQREAFSQPFLYARHSRQPSSCSSQQSFALANDIELPLRCTISECSDFASGLAAQLGPMGLGFNSLGHIQSFEMICS